MPTRNELLATIDSCCKALAANDAARLNWAEGARVADTSIFPHLPGGNTDLPVIMVAERAADFIWEDAQWGTNREESQGTRERQGSYRHRTCCAGPSSRPCPIRLAPLMCTSLIEQSLATTPRIRQANLESATSWRIGQLSFDRESLGSIAQEFNRYNRTKIVIADPSIAETRFSGVFNANDPESFIAFLELSDGVRVDKSRDREIRVAAAARRR